LCCEKTVASNIWKNHLAQVWWDFVKRIGTIKPIRWYLDTIHTLVVRVWRIGLRVICGRCACFGRTTAEPTWQAIGTTKSNSVAKDPHNFHLHSTSGFEPSATASQAPSTWRVVSTPKSSSVTEGDKDFRTGVWTLNAEPSWGPRVPVYWAITPGPGVLAFVLKFLLFKGLVLQRPDHVLFALSLIFEWIPWQPFYFVYLFVFSSNSLPWALALIVCNIWLSYHFYPGFSTARNKLLLVQMCFLPTYWYFNFMLDILMP
jgi:hypothetical protein